MNIMKVKASDAMRGLTLRAEVTGLKRLAVRAWIGTRILMLAAIMFGCRVEVVIADRREA
ncbi:hypothetical protein [Sphingomonas sanxanigenens]|uniref:Uncharacterized protein n=1 Tax=Sphingomonas sanxanigenens DSM 19645 = NX02 TaxID=1123269 RepID=W0AH78_9SPHN|nr:hypothetical protein [Sphingomonas sanxanigenens]AHE55907.1 hypothetical protein NX02_21375 [Sphingomonas sanxanigenens DSM 19645 = NX02]